jgi:hypothetical protein
MAEAVNHDGAENDGDVVLRVPAVSLPGAVALSHFWRLTAAVRRLSVKEGASTMTKITLDPVLITPADQVRQENALQ